MTDLSFNPFLDAVAATIHAWLPELASCESHPGRFDLGELKAFATKAPAVRVAVLGWGESDPLPSGDRDVTLLMAAYIVTKDAAGLPRHAAALNLAEALARLIPDHTFGAEWAHGATELRAQNLYSGEVNKAGVTLWALSWSQMVRIGASDPENLPIPSELYLSCVPEVGPPHIDDYELLLEP